VQEVLLESLMLCANTEPKKKTAVSLKNAVHSDRVALENHKG